MVKLVKSLTVADLKKIAAKWNISCSGNKSEILSHVTEEMINRDLDPETYEFTEELERDEIEVVPTVDMSAILAAMTGMQEMMQKQQEMMQKQDERQQEMMQKQDEKQQEMMQKQDERQQEMMKNNKEMLEKLEQKQEQQHIKVVQKLEDIKTVFEEKSDQIQTEVDVRFSNVEQHVPDLKINLELENANISFEEKSDQSQTKADVRFSDVEQPMPDLKINLELENANISFEEKSTAFEEKSDQSQTKADVGFSDVKQQTPDFKIKLEQVKVQPVNLMKLETETKREVKPAVFDGNASWQTASTRNISTYETFSTLSKIKKWSFKVQPVNLMKLETETKREMKSAVFDGNASWQTSSTRNISTFETFLPVIKIKKWSLWNYRKRKKEF